MSSVVLDASVALAWFLPESKPLADYARAAFKRIVSDTDATVPSTWHLEIAAVLARRYRARVIDDETLARARKVLLFIPLDARPVLRSAGEILDLALRYELQAGDALYLELALSTGLPIATLDRGLQTAALRHGVALFEP